MVGLMVNGLHLYSAFLTSGHLKPFSIFPNIHAQIHTPTAESATHATVSSSGAVRVRRLAQGHLDTQLGGAGIRTSDLLVTSKPALPPEQRTAVGGGVVFPPTVWWPLLWSLKCVEQSLQSDGDRPDVFRAETQSQGDTLCISRELRGQACTNNGVCLFMNYTSCMT